MGPCVQNFLSRGCCVCGCKSPKAGGKKWKKKPKKVILTSWEIQSIKLIQSGKEEQRGVGIRSFFQGFTVLKGQKQFSVTLIFTPDQDFSKIPSSCKNPWKKEWLLVAIEHCEKIEKRVLFWNWTKYLIFYLWLFDFRRLLTYIKFFVLEIYVFWVIRSQCQMYLVLSSSNSIWYNNREKKGVREVENLISNNTNLLLWLEVFY